MVLYECPRCGFQNKIKTKMRNHYYRKNPCAITKRNISIEGCLGLLDNNLLKVPEKNPENSLKNPENSGNIPETLKISQKHPENSLKNPENCQVDSQFSHLNLQNGHEIGNLFHCERSFEKYPKNFFSRSSNLQNIPRNSGNFPENLKITEKSQNIPEKSQNIPEKSQNIPEKISQNIPEKISQNFTGKISQNIPEKISQKKKVSSHNNNKSSSYRRKSSKNPKRYKCSFCNKSFTRKDNLKVHINQYCKTLENSDDISTEDENSLDTNSSLEDTSILENSILENLKNQDSSIIENLKNQLLVEKINRERDQEIINDLRSQVGTLLEKVGDTYNTNTYNIVINPFGQENTSYITKDYINSIIDQGPYDSIPKLLEYIHFNPKHKENHNIKITNKKQPYAQIYDGSKWLIRDKKQTIDDMSDKAYTLLNEHYSGQNEYMNKFQSEYDDRSPEIIKRIYKDVEISILNQNKQQQKIT